MVTGELLSTQLILNNSNVSTSQSTLRSNQSFKDLLLKKSDSIPLEAYTGIEAKSVSNNETAKSVNRNIEENSTINDVKNLDQQTDTASDAKVQTAKPQNDYEADDENLQGISEEDEKLVAFKELLKKKTRLHDEEIDDLLALMGSDIRSFIESIPVKSLESLDFTSFVKAANLLQNIEVNQMLNVLPDDSLMTSLSERLVSFAEALNEAVSSNEVNKMSFEELAAMMKMQVKTMDMALNSDSQKSVKEILGEMVQINENTSHLINESQSSQNDVGEMIAESDDDIGVKTTETTAEYSSQSGDAKNPQMKQNELTLNETGNEAQINANLQDQKIFETTLKNFEVRQIPRQEVLIQVMDAIKSNLTVNQQGSQLTVKLQPEQLGSVEVKLSMHKGIVLAEIKVENEIVKAAIETNLSQLKQSLQQKGYQTNQISVTVDSGNKGDDQSSLYQQQQQQQQNNYENQTDEAEIFLEKVGLTYRLDDSEHISIIDYFG